MTFSVGDTCQLSVPGGGPDTLAPVGGVEGATGVSDSGAGAWTGDEAPPSQAPTVREFEEQLALRDRIAALEAQLADLRAEESRTPTELLSAEQRILAMQSSFAWRLGNALTSPRRVLRRIFRR